jgi:hypothetical protein
MKMCWNVRITCCMYLLSAYHFEAYSSILYQQQALIFINYTFRLQSRFVCAMWLYKQQVVNWLLLIKEPERVYWAVRTESPTIVPVINASLSHTDLRNLAWFQSSMPVRFCHNIRYAGSKHILSQYTVRRQQTYFVTIYGAQAANIFYKKSWE